MGVFSHGQILVHHPELDRFVQPTVSYDLVQTIMDPQPRFAQFDFRDVPAGKGDGEMRFHRDRPYQPTTETEPERPYECTYVCAIHYLSDVGAGRHTQRRASRCSGARGGGDRSSVGV